MKKELPDYIDPERLYSFVQVKSIVGVGRERGQAWIDNGILKVEKIEETHHNRYRPTLWIKGSHIKELWQYEYDKQQKQKTR